MAESKFIPHILAILAQWRLLADTTDDPGELSLEVTENEMNGELDLPELQRQFCGMATIVEDTSW